MAGLVHRKDVATVVNAAAAGAIGVLLVDARSPEDFFNAQELLRTLYDDPRSPRRVMHPDRVLGLIATGDVEAAFALGRYGIAGVSFDVSPQSTRSSGANGSLRPTSFPSKAALRAHIEAYIT